MRAVGAGGETRGWLERVEADDVGEPEAALSFLALPAVRLDPALLHAARRRAVLLLAVGGDPLRELDVEGRAVRSLAAELDDAERRAELVRALAELRAAAGGLPGVAAALDTLLADGDRAWRFLAAALLADELAGGDD
jgi:hypothetical protein